MENTSWEDWDESWWWNEGYSAQDDQGWDNWWPSDDYQGYQHDPYESGYWNSSQAWSGEQGHQAEQLKDDSIIPPTLSDGDKKELEDLLSQQKDVEAFALDFHGIGGLIFVVLGSSGGWLATITAVLVSSLCSCI